jgi:hypothetical protein
VLEYQPAIIWARTKYRQQFAGDADCEAKVAAKLVKFMDMLGVKCPCGRQMNLNAETRDDFMARANAY